MALEVETAVDEYEEISLDDVIQEIGDVNPDEMQNLTDGELECTEDERSYIQSEIARMKEILKNIEIDDIKSGDWFVQLITYSLRQYALTVNAEYLREKYPTLPTDAIVDTRIKLAARYAALEGAMSASAYTATVAATMGTGGAASPLSVPAAIASFGVDMLYTTDLQLKLAYDIATLYGTPLNLQDPEDLWKLVLLAFNVKASEVTRESIPKAAPAFVRVAVRRFYKGDMIKAGKSLPVVGKHLLQRNVTKFAIPLVTIPLSTAVNYWTTISCGNSARALMRNEARIREASLRLTAGAEYPRELLWVMWLLMNADGKLHEDEKQFLHHVSLELGQDDELKDTLHELRTVIEIDTQKVWAMVEALGSEGQSLYDAALKTASIDGSISPSEKKVLEKLAKVTGVAFDPEDLKRYLPVVPEEQQNIASRLIGRLRRK